eukprot:m.178952 g.178952  ORF g.178952 m.178952 type:complete len:845 (-) comp13562_c0_seq3:66-2600(-)
MLMYMIEIFPRSSSTSCLFPFIEASTIFKKHCSVSLFNFLNSSPCSNQQPKRYITKKLRRMTAAMELLLYTATTTTTPTTTTTAPPWWRTTSANRWDPRYSTYSTAYNPFYTTYRRRRAADDEPCDSCTANTHLVVDGDNIKDAVEVDTCSADTGVQATTIRTHCGTTASASNKAYVVSMELDVGHYVISASASSYDVVLQLREDTCCGHFVKCSGHVVTAGDNHTLELIVEEKRTYVVAATGTVKEGCGTLSLSLEHKNSSTTFVDCMNGKDTTGDGSYNNPLKSLLAAITAVASKFDAAVDGSANIVLKPSQGCSYIPPLSTFDMPESIRNELIVISSINGDATSLSSLVSAHLRICTREQEEAGDDKCIKPQDFATMSYGTAFDTKVKVPPQLERDSPHAFRFNNMNVVFKGIGFEKFANVNSEGAVVHAESSTLEFENCMFSDNTGHRGGALFAQSSTITISHCIASDNKGTLGGFAAVYDSTLIVVGSHLTNNVASVSHGGAIFASNSHVTVVSSVFAGNSAEMFGGAIEIEGNNATLVVSPGTSMNSNDAGKHGGAVCVRSGASMETNNVVMLRNSAGLYGGAVAVMGEGTTWKDTASSIAECTSPAAYVYDSGSADLYHTSLKKNSPFGASDALFESRPGALLCVYASMKTRSVNAQSSLDAFGNPERNIGCVSCDGCFDCGVCGSCSMCTEEGCDVTSGDKSCAATAPLGFTSTCDRDTETCETVEVTTSATTTSATGAPSTTGTSTDASSTTATATSSEDAEESGNTPGSDNTSTWQLTTYVMGGLLFVILVAAVVVVVMKRKKSRVVVHGHQSFNNVNFEENGDNVNMFNHSEA